MRPALLPAALAALLAAPLALAPALPAFARPPEAAEAKALQTAVTVYLNAIGRGEAARVVAALPPRVKNIFAGSAGIEAGKLDATLTEQTEVMLKSAKFSDLGADFDGLDVTDSVLTDGSKVTWAVVPTHFTIQTDKGKTQNAQPLLVVGEGGKWYMMRMESGQSQQLVAIAYPFLKDVKFPAPSSKPAG